MSDGKVFTAAQYKEASDLVVDPDIPDEVKEKLRTKIAAYEAASNREQSQPTELALDPVAEENVRMALQHDAAPRAEEPEPASVLAEVEAKLSQEFPAETFVPLPKQRSDRKEYHRDLELQPTMGANPMESLTRRWLLEPGEGGNMVRYFEPSIAHVRESLKQRAKAGERFNYRGHTLTSANLGKLHDKHPIVERERDRLYAEAYDNASAKGWGIKRMDLLSEERESLAHDVESGVYRAGQAIKGGIHSAADAASFGLSSPLTSGLAGMTTDPQMTLANVEKAKQTNPMASAAAGMGGAMLGAPGRLGAGLIGLGSRALGAAPGLGARLGVAAGAGALGGVAEEGVRMGAETLDPNQPVPVDPVGRLAMGAAAGLVGGGVGEALLSGGQAVGRGLKNWANAVKRNPDGSYSEPKDSFGKAALMIEEEYGNLHARDMKGSGTTRKGMRRVGEFERAEDEAFRSGYQGADAALEKMADEISPEVGRQLQRRGGDIAAKQHAVQQKVYGETESVRVDTKPMIDYLNGVIKGRQRTTPTGDLVDLPEARLGPWRNMIDKLTDSVTVGEGGLTTSMGPHEETIRMSLKEAAETLGPRGQRMLKAAADEKGISLIPRSIDSAAPPRPGVERLDDPDPTGGLGNWRVANPADEVVMVDVRVPAKLSVRELDEFIRLGDAAAKRPGMAEDPATAGFQRVSRELRDTIPSDTPELSKVEPITAEFRDETGRMRQVELTGYSALKHRQSLELGKQETLERTLGVFNKDPKRLRGEESVARMAMVNTANAMSQGEGVKAKHVYDGLQTIFAGRPEMLQKVRDMRRYSAYKRLTGSMEARRETVTHGLLHSVDEFRGTARGLAPTTEQLRFRAHGLGERLADRGQSKFEGADKEAAQELWAQLPTRMKKAIRGKFRPGWNAAQLPHVPALGAARGHLGAQIGTGGDSLETPREDEYELILGMIGLANELDPDSPEVTDVEPVQ